MPAHKKDSSVRARRNVASTASTLPSSRTGRGRGVGKPPELPPLEDIEVWHPLTVAWWKDLWGSPMSREYHVSDRHQLVLLAALMNDFFTATSRTMRKEISGEIRLHRQSFGLTPYDRRRLEWTIELAEEAKAAGGSRRQRQGTSQPTAKDDPRSALSLVPPA